VNTASGISVFKVVEGCMLIGAGGHARVAAATMMRLGAPLLAILETDAARIGEALAEVIVTADTGQIDQPLHIAIGSNSARRRVDAVRRGAFWRTLIHPDALIAPAVEIGDGSLIGMGAMVQTGAHIGRHVIINTGAVIEHDNWIGDFAHVGPGAVLGGDVRVGEAALIGAGAVILPGMHVGANAVVGAGAVVTRPVRAGETVTGVPARVVARP
jgi:sugar O-acyltransferase (sialic acid O-acetyltransferase NeuD family)